jgi:hypothetical protein
VSSRPGTTTCAFPDGLRTMTGRARAWSGGFAIADGVNQFHGRTVSVGTNVPPVRFRDIPGLIE